MRITYDEKTDTLYIRFSEKKYFQSDELKQNFIVDYDKNQKIIAIEVLHASDMLSTDELSSVSFDILKKMKHTA